MDKKHQEEVALFRFGVISDLVTSRLKPGEAARIIRKKSLQRWDIPFSNRTRLSESTIRRWLRLYMASDRELQSLYPASRSDKGKSRRIDEETILLIVRLRKEKPDLPVNRLYEQIKEKKLVPPGVPFSLSTVYRVLHREGLSRRQSVDRKDRRRYEAEYPNDIWQSDVMHGPSVMVGGKKRKTYLIAFLDDHSRLLPHGEFYLSEQLVSYLDAFRQALLTRGLPRKLYVDNGAAFRSRHLERVCASLGIALIHSPPYTPQGRGKIERFFRTVRTQFLPDFQGNTLDELNVCFDLWTREIYHQRTHSSTGESPFNRFARHVELLRTPPADLENHFRKEVRRRVTKDRTVSINSVLFEAPAQLIGEQVSLLFHEHLPNRVEIIHKGTSRGFLQPLDLHINSKTTRQVDYEKRTVAGKTSRQGLLPFGPKE